MKKTKKKLPKFKNEDEERLFWTTHSPLDYFDMSTARKIVFSRDEQKNDSLKSLRGTILHYEGPFEPVANADWELLP